MPGWVWIVYALATARLTGLITADEITRPVRDGILCRLDDRRPMHQAAAYLISCSWCASIYIGAVAAVVTYWHGTNPWALVPALALAFSLVAGATSDMGRGE